MEHTCLSMTPLIRTVAALCLVFPMTASAVHVMGNTPNNTAPVDDPGFANIGTLNGATAVYLGNGWVLTASHVGAGTVTLGGVPYAQLSAPIQLTNQGAGGMTANTDMILFQITVPPLLPALNIRASSPGSGDDLVMIGNGVNQNAARDKWTVTTVPNPEPNPPNEDNDIWTPDPAGTVQTFGSPGGNTIRWGTNNIEGIGDVNSAFGTVRSIASLFNDTPGKPNEAQAVLGDSGSGVFWKNGGSWELAGMTYAVGNNNSYDNIPGGNTTSIVNSSITFMADLSFYRSQILSIIPEPGSASLGLLGLAGFLGRRRRQAPRR